jgi:RNA-directed DNA polymerase
LSERDDTRPVSQPRTRQEIYDRIRETSKDEFILDEMVRLGFWPSEQKVPTVPGRLIKRRGELERELRALITERERLEDRERMLRELRKRRFAEAKQKRQETRERRERERQERAAAWRMRKQREIVYLGNGVSAGLEGKASDRSRLEAHGLPVFQEAADIAASMGVELAELRFLAFSRRVSRTSHYQRFRIPKKSGGERLISAPMPRLKEAQRWLLENVLSKVRVHESAHGFLPGRSIVSNARPHVGAAVVVNADLENFFPTITYRRVKGAFRSLGYSEQVASVFALLSTEPDSVEVELDGCRYHVARGERHLPQGAPTSPALTNVICRRMDRRLKGLAAKLGFAYTRYADDLSFSGPGESVRNLCNLLRWCQDIVEHEGFRLHQKKTRIMRRGRKQEVTGIVVNERCGLDRKMLRRLRATLYQIEKDGPNGRHWNGNVNVVSAVQGVAAYATMVDERKGRILLGRTRALTKRHDYVPPRWPEYPKRVPSWKRSKEPVVQTGPTTDDTLVRKRPWWKFW